MARCGKVSSDFRRQSCGTGATCDNSHDEPHETDMGGKKLTKATFHMQPGTVSIPGRVSCRAQNVSAESGICNPGSPVIRPDTNPAASELEPGVSQHYSRYRLRVARMSSVRREKEKRHAKAT